jgi:hypothetical protein
VHSGAHREGIASTKESASRPADCRAWALLFHHMSTVRVSCVIGRPVRVPSCFCPGAHERDMFTLIADSAIEAMSVVFEMTRDESALEKTLQVCSRWQQAPSRPCRVWCGAVWCGVAWCGVVWCVPS